MEAKHDRRSSSTTLARAIAEHILWVIDHSQHHGGRAICAPVVLSLSAGDRLYRE
jgi:hypothetical protein